MRLVYVFNPAEATGYVCRVPEFIARLITSRAATEWHGRCLDYAPTPEGF